MERILNAFKALYKGERVWKVHLIAALLFYLPCLAGATFQLIDKDMKELIVPLFIVGTVLLILSIIPMFVLSGFYLKFVNKRFSEAVGLPKFDWDCLKKGVKFFPVPFVWTIYIGVPVILYLVIVLASFGFYISSKPGALDIILSTIAMFGLLFLLYIPLFIISPFIAFINLKYSENFEYSAELFNPLTPFRYMKKVFKDAVIVALKFLVVSIVTSFASQFVIFLGVLFVILFMILIAIAVPENVDIYKLPAFIIPAIIVSGALGVLSAYIRWITGLAYADNLLDVYKDKIMDNSTVELVEEIEE